MKRTIVTTIIAVLLSALSLSAQDVKPVYLIDGVEVKNFDGSQLIGKKVLKYLISGNVHTITTDMAGKTTGTPKITGSQMPLNPDAVYVIDGVVATEEEFMAVSPSKIDSLTILKVPGDPVFQQYAVSNNSTVIMIKTK